MKLALFDFDGTITTRDTYTKFVISNASIFRIILGGFLLSPLILLNKLKLLPSPLLRPVITKLAFKGTKVDDINQRAQEYVHKYLPKVIRPNMLYQIQKHQESGDRVVVVSASISPYLKIWCKGLSIELICSELEEKDGYFTGSYVNGDCSGQRKADSVKNTINLDSFEQVIAYGDTKEDHAMLKLAHESYFRGKPFSANDC